MKQTVSWSLVSRAKGLNIAHGEAANQRGMAKQIAAVLEHTHPTNLQKVEGHVIELVVNFTREYR